MLGGPSNAAAAAEFLPTRVPSQRGNGCRRDWHEGAAPRAECPLRSVGPIDDRLAWDAGRPPPIRESFRAESGRRRFRGPRCPR